jgi:hypothetical protein
MKNSFTIYWVPALTPTTIEKLQNNEITKLTQKEKKVGPFKI